MARPAKHAMSIQLIQQYHAKVEKLIRYGGSRNEGALRKAFQDLLEAYALGKNLLLVPEVEVRTRGVSSPTARSKTPCVAFRPKRGATAWGRTRLWKGCWYATKSARPKTPLSAKSSTPTALPITKSQWLTCSGASAR